MRSRGLEIVSNLSKVTEVNQRVKAMNVGILTLKHMGSAIFYTRCIWKYLPDPQECIIQEGRKQGSQCFQEVVLSEGGKG